MLKRCVYAGALLIGLSSSAGVFETVIANRATLSSFDWDKVETSTVWNSSIWTPLEPNSPEYKSGYIKKATESLGALQFSWKLYHKDQKLTAIFAMTPGPSVSVCERTEKWAREKFGKESLSVDASYENRSATKPFLDFRKRMQWNIGVTRVFFECIGRIHPEKSDSKAIEASLTFTSSNNAYIYDVKPLTRLRCKKETISMDDKVVNGVSFEDDIFIVNENDQKLLQADKVPYYGEHTFEDHKFGLKTVIGAKIAEIEIDRYAGTYQVKSDNIKVRGQCVKEEFGKQKF